MRDLLPYYTPPFQPTVLPVKKKDGSLWVIFAAVLTVHAILLGAAGYSSHDDKMMRPKGRLVVKTIALEPRPTTTDVAYMPPAPPTPPQPTYTPPPQPTPPPPPPQPAAPPTPPQPKEPPPPPQPTPFVPPPQPAPPPMPAQPLPPPETRSQIAEEVKPAPKKSSPKPAKVKKPTTPTPKAKSKPKTTPAADNKKKPTSAKPKPSEPQKPDPVAEAKKAKQRELLSKVKDSMTKVSQARSQVSKQPSADIAQAEVPKAIGSLQIDAFTTGEPVVLTTKETSYRDEIAHRLKLGLRLPEYGEVKIKLTIERSGKVAQVQIVSSKNTKNKQYVEKTVPTLTFPSFGDNFNGSQQYTFVICLNNEY